MLHVGAKHCGEVTCTPHGVEAAGICTGPLPAESFGSDPALIHGGTISDGDVSVITRDKRRRANLTTFQSKFAKPQHVRRGVEGEALSSLRLHPTPRMDELLKECETKGAEMVARNQQWKTVRPSFHL